jgi:L-fuconolactonase
MTDLPDARTIREKPSRIDAHQHFWRYRAPDYPWIGKGMQALAQDRLPEHLSPLLQAQGLDASIAVQARAGCDETRFLLDLANRTGWIAGVVGWEELGADDLAGRLDQWRNEAKLVGFRHQVQDEADAQDFLDAPAFNRGVAMLQSQGYVYDVLVFEHQLAAAAQFCARHDRNWLVLDHLGKPALCEFSADDRALTRWRDSLSILGGLPHVVCKLSGLVTEADWRHGLRDADIAHIRNCLDTALEAFGPQRLMFGSDWPVCLLAAPYAQVVELIANWAATRLTPDEQADLWGGTAARCYCLET